MKLHSNTQIELSHYLQNQFETMNITTVNYLRNIGFCSEFPGSFNVITMLLQLQRFLFHHVKGSKGEKFQMKCLKIYLIFEKFEES